MTLFFLAPSRDSEHAAMKLQLMLRLDFTTSSLFFGDMLILDQPQIDSPIIDILLRVPTASTTHRVSSF